MSTYTVIMLIICVVVGGTCYWYFDRTFSAWRKSESDKDQ